MINEYARLAALTMQLCGFQPSYDVVQQIYGVMFHTPRPGHYPYVADAICLALAKPRIGGDCPRVNNVCLK